MTNHFDHGLFPCIYVLDMYPHVCKQFMSSFIYIPQALLAISWGSCKVLAI